MKMQSHIVYRLKYKISSHKRVNKIKVAILSCSGWLLNKLCGVTIEMHLIDGGFIGEVENGKGYKREI